MLRSILLLGILLVVLTGCGLSGLGGQPSINEAQLRLAQDSSTLHADAPTLDKMIVPLDLDLTIDTPNISLGTNVPLTLRFQPLKDVDGIKSHVEAFGVVTVTQAADQVWSNLVAHQDVHAQTTARITGRGEGTIRGEVQVLDQSGRLLYGRSATIYVLATEQGILTGNSSPAQLRREYLAQARQSGTLTQQEYEKALDQLLYGGAAETSSIIVPTPTR